MRRSLYQERSQKKPEDGYKPTSVPSLKYANELFPVNRDEDSGLPEDEAPTRRGAANFGDST